MTSFRTINHAALASVLLTPIAFAIWLMATPHQLPVSTVVISMALLVGVVIVVLNSARNAGATGSVAQLLHATEIDAAGSPISPGVTDNRGWKP